MTYRDLLNLLSKMDEESLNMTVTVNFEDEYYPAKIVIADDNQSVLDVGHIFFAPEE